MSRGLLIGLFLLLATLPGAAACTQTEHVGQCTGSDACNGVDPPPCTCDCGDGYPDEVPACIACTGGVWVCLSNSPDGAS